MFFHTATTLNYDGSLYTGDYPLLTHSVFENFEVSASRVPVHFIHARKFRSAS